MNKQPKTSKDLACNYQNFPAYTYATNPPHSNPWKT